MSDYLPDSDPTSAVEMEAASFHELLHKMPTDTAPGAVRKLGVIGPDNVMRLIPFRLKASSIGCLWMPERKILLIP